MRGSDVVLIAAIWGALGVAAGPQAWRRWHVPPPPVVTSGERYFDTSRAGVIFYTTPANLLLDTATCSLTRDGISNGK